MRSPVKADSKAGNDRLGNAVFVFTKLPTGQDGLRRFLPQAAARKKHISYKDVYEAVSSKVRDHFYFFFFTYF